MFDVSYQSDHDMRVSHNRGFYNSVRTTEFPDWAIVVLFYEVVHMIESVLAENGIHPKDHVERRECIRSRPDIFSHDLVRSYTNLESLSRTARYKPEIAVSTSMVYNAQLDNDEIRKWYEKHTS